MFRPEPAPSARPTPSITPSTTPSGRSGRSVLFQGKNLLVLYRECPVSREAFAAAVRMCVPNVSWFAVAHSTDARGAPEMRVAFNFSIMRYVRAFREFELLGYRPATLGPFKNHFTCCADFYALDPNYHREVLTPALREEHLQGTLTAGPRGMKGAPPLDVRCLQMVLDVIWQELDAGKHRDAFGRLDYDWIAEVANAHGLDSKYDARLWQWVRLGLRRPPDPARGRISRPLTDAEEGQLFDWLCSFPAGSEPPVR